MKYLPLDVKQQSINQSIKLPYDKDMCSFLKVIGQPVNVCYLYVFVVVFFLWTIIPHLHILYVNLNAFDRIGTSHIVFRMLHPTFYLIICVLMHPYLHSCILILSVEGKILKC